MDASYTFSIRFIRQEIAIEKQIGLEFGRIWNLDFAKFRQN